MHCSFDRFHDDFVRLPSASQSQHAGLNATEVVITNCITVTVTGHLLETSVRIRQQLQLQAFFFGRTISITLQVLSGCLAGDELRSRDWQANSQSNIITHVFVDADVWF